jgi:quercetin dioxygenase-like cupin family protein
MEKVVEKMWGYEKWITNTPKYCTKEMGLERGFRCSLHFHKVKDETFYVLKGKVLMEIQTDSSEKIIERVLSPGATIRIFPGIKHRFSGLEDSVILESSTHHEDSDSYRVEGELSGEIPEEIMKKYE